MDDATIEACANAGHSPIEEPEYLSESGPFICCQCRCRSRTYFHSLWEIKWMDSGADVLIENYERVREMAGIANDDPVMPMPKRA